MNAFQNLQNDWGVYLEKTGDISSPEHLSFLKKLQLLLEKDFHRTDIPETDFYIQTQAAFYRFRILELITSSGEKYQVNFHLFPEGQTRIHSHGYEGHSFVLEGELEYKNFIPQRVGAQRQKDLENMLPHAFAGREDPQRVAEQVFRELEELFLGQRTKVSFNTQVFSAFIGGGDDDEFGKFTLPEDIIHLLCDTKNIFYELQKTHSGTIKKGESYSVGLHEAHTVIVPEQALTLFITKAHPFSHIDVLSGGEYYHFRTPREMQNFESSAEHVRDTLCAALRRVRI